ncbi:hypothetical protein SX4_2838 [Vibrio mimicus SX-4]|nr:hypothetical protein SX4_2838 [Vibrio mimicus SX-4]
MSLHATNRQSVKTISKIILYIQLNEHTSSEHDLFALI